MSRPDPSVPSPGSGSFRGALASRLRAALGSAAARQGAWTVLDQALFSGSNFVVNILLARWLAPEAFGAFATAFTVFLVVGTLHAGLLVEPMLVFGASRFERRRRAYLRRLVVWHGQFSALAGAGFGVAAVAIWTLGYADEAALLAALGVSQGAILLLWLARRACLVVRRPAVAAAGGAAYLVVLVGGTVALSAAGALTAATGFLAMGAASLAVAIVLLARLGVPVRRPRADTPDFRAGVRAAHWTYGRWSMPTGVLEWVVSALPFLVVPFVLGVEGNALLRALFNLALPALQAFVAMSAFALPILVRARSAGRMGRAMTRFGALAVAGAAVYAVVLGTGGDWLLDALYDGKYRASGAELWLLGAYPLAVGLGSVFTASLRASETPRAVFWARVAAIALGAPVTVALAVAYGVAGGLAGGLATLAAEAIALAVAAWLAGSAPRRASAVTGPRRRVLLVAFACDPARGSEYGQGWRFAEAAAEAGNDVWVLTYAGQVASVQAHLAVHPNPAIHLVPVAHPLERKRHVAGTPRATIAEQVHYYVWQLSAARDARRLHRAVGFDVVHHITFGKSWAPSAGAFVDAPFVLGPVGGGESAPLRFWAGFSLYGLVYETARSAGRLVARLDPIVRFSTRRSALAIGSTDETARLLRHLGARHTVAQPSIGLMDAEVEALRALPPPPGGPLRIVMSGRLLHWKGFDLGLRAAAGVPGATVEIVGVGPERARLERLAARLGVAATFHGQLPRADALAVLGRANVLLHPSLHDSGGFVTLEALAAGRAVVALDLGGPGVQLTPESGIAVAAVSRGQAVADLTAALGRLDADDALRARLGAGGQARIDATFRVHHVAAHALAAYDALAPLPDEHDPDDPETGTSDGASVPLRHVGLVRRTG